LAIRVTYETTKEKDRKGKLKQNSGSKRLEERERTSPERNPKTWDSGTPCST